MPVFNYRFERILNIKLKMEEQKQQELALIGMEIEKQQEKFNAIEQDKNRNLASISDAQSEKIDIFLVRQLMEYKLVLQKKQEIALSLIKEYKGLYADKMKELIAASQERKKYEKLRERKYSRYLYQASIASQNEQNEMGQTLFIRKMNE